MLRATRFCARKSEGGHIEGPGRETRTATDSYVFEIGVWVLVGHHAKHFVVTKLQDVSVNAPLYFDPYQTTGSP